MGFDCEKLVKLAGNYRAAENIQKIMADNSNIMLEFGGNNEKAILFLDDIQEDAAQSELVSKFAQAMEEYKQALNRRIKGVVH